MAIGLVYIPYLFFSYYRPIPSIPTDEASPAETKVQLAAPPRVALRNQRFFFPLGFEIRRHRTKDTRAESEAPSTVVCISIGKNAARDYRRTENWYF